MLSQQNLKENFMQYINIPGTPLTVSRLCLGTMNYGTSLPEKEAADHMDRFLGSGGNFIDTASVYSDWIPGERSRVEKIIGRYFVNTGKRADVVLSTKGAHPDLDAFTVGRVTEKDIRHDLEASLQNLRTDYIDLYFLHRDDVSVPIGEIVELMNHLVKEGKIRTFGCSNFSRARLEAAQKYAGEKGLMGFSSNQIMWSLARVNRDKVPDKTLALMDDDFLAYHQKTGTHVMAYSSQAKGYFSKRAAGRAISDSVASVYQNDDNDIIFAEMQKASRETGIPVTALSLRYFDACGFPACPVVSLSNRAQLNEALSAYSAYEDISALDDFFGKVCAMSLD